MEKYGLGFRSDGMYTYLWFMLYAPWVEFTKSTFGTVSLLATLADYVASLSIPIGNALISFVVGYIVELYGYRNIGHSRQWYLRMIIPCLFINVMSDLYVTFLSAVSGVNEGLSKSTNFQFTFGVRVLEGDLFALLFPGYSMIPYIGEPFCCVLVPFLVGTWRIKQDSRISAEYAERLMEAAEIDIVNPPYGDMVVTSAVFVVCFFAPGRNSWKLFMAYLIFAVFLYCQNRWRLLRWQTMCYFGTRDLHVSESYLWGLPLGILAAAFGCRLAPVFFGPDAGVGASVGLGCASFVGHNLLQICFLRSIGTRFRRGKQEKKARDLNQVEYNKTYEHAETQNHMGANYRNTNPIEVLKSQYMSGEQRSFAPEEEPLVFYKWGKGHLQPKTIQEKKSESDRVRTVTTELAELTPTEKRASHSEALLQDSDRSELADYQVHGAADSTPDS